ncbi:MAG: carotenoid oxygenase family protein [Aquabacterium sp.]|nr:carotenoid oxygenase family protein [Aquabacterium sp.]
MQKFQLRAAGRCQPWTLGYAGLQSGAEPTPLQLHGRLPQELQGQFLRNGPGRHSLRGQRRHHWLDDDGMLQRDTLDPPGILHQGRFFSAHPKVEPCGTL